MRPRLLLLLVCCLWVACGQDEFVVVPSSYLQVTTAALVRFFSASYIAIKSYDSFLGGDGGGGGDGGQRVCGGDSVGGVGEVARCVDFSRRPARLKFHPKARQTAYVGPRLCRVKDREASQQRTAVLMIVNSVAYLQGPGNWEAFLNKAAYARKTKRPFYLWVGDLEAATLAGRHAVPWLPCAEKPGNTLNIYKTVAIFAAFQGARTLLYVDADAWFSDAAFKGAAEPESYLNVSSRAFLMGNQNRVGGPKIPMNGGLLLLRDSQRAKRFLALWFYSRCGAHDQLPLWASLFATVAADANNNHRHKKTGRRKQRLDDIDDDYAHDNDDGDAEKKNNKRVALPFGFFRTYDEAHHKAVALLADRLDDLRRPLLDRDPTNALDGGNFRTSHILDRPLELPGILLLPSAKLGDLPALRSDINTHAKTFVCHTRIDSQENQGQCIGSHVCKKHKCMPFLP